MQTICFSFSLGRQSVLVCVFVRKCLKIEVKGKTRRQQHCAARGAVVWGWGVENAFNRWEML